MCVYGLKGGCAYFYHAEGVRKYKKESYTEEKRLEVFNSLINVTASLTDPS